MHIFHRQPLTAVILVFAFLLLGTQLDIYTRGGSRLVLEELDDLEASLLSQDHSKHQVKSKATNNFTPSRNGHSGEINFIVGNEDDQSAKRGWSKGLPQVVKPSSQKKVPNRTITKTPLKDVDLRHKDAVEPEGIRKIPTLASEDEEDEETPDENIIKPPQKMVYYTPFAAGLGDRLRGMVVAYYLAALTGRKLLIKNPIGNASLIEINSDYVPHFETVPSHLTKHLHRPVSMEIDLLGRENFTLLANVDVIEFNSNRANLTQLFDHPEFRGTPAMNQIMKLRERGLMWHTPLSSTMKPGGRIRRLLGRIRKDHLNGQFYKVALHFRISDSFMRISHKAKRDNIKTNITWVHLSPSQVQSIWNGLPNKDKYSDGMKVFVTADTPSYAIEAQQALTRMNISWFDTIPYAGTPVHVKYKGDQTRTVLDWWLFTEMDFIIATRSGFSESAAKYSCKGYSVFCPNGDDSERFITYPSPGLCRPMDFDMYPYRCPPG